MKIAKTAILLDIADDPGAIRLQQPDQNLARHALGSDAAACVIMRERALYPRRFTVRIDGQTLNLHPHMVDPSVCERILVHLIIRCARTLANLAEGNRIPLLKRLLVTPND